MGDSSQETPFRASPLPDINSEPGKPRLRHVSRAGESDTRWVVGMNVGSVSLVLGMALLTVYIMDPAFLYATRVAAGAIILAAVAAVALLLQGVSRKSRRLRILPFWLILAGNLALIPALTICVITALRHAPPAPPSGSEDAAETTSVFAPSIVNESPVT